MFRISGAEHSIADVESVEQIMPAIKAADPGRYFVYEIMRGHAGSIPFGRCWGIGTKYPDGLVVIRPDHHLHR